MQDLKREVITKLAEVSKDPKYRELIRFLIAQGLLTMLEHEVTLQCRQEDLKIVEGELPAALKMFREQLVKSTGIQPTCNVNIDTTNFLPAGPKPGQQGASCAGGVILSSRGGQILCRNTLDSRLDIAFEHSKPQIRGTLFGFREKIAAVVDVKKGLHRPA